MKIRNRTREAKRSAFTLMEMLVVVAIIIALAAVGGYYLLGQLQSSRTSAAKAQLQVVTKAVQNYMIKNNGAPPQNLQMLLQPDPNNDNMPYLENMEAITDPYGQQFVYDQSGQRNNGLKPDIFFRDPKNGQDIGNWTHK